MTDNLTIRRKGYKYYVMTSISHRELFTGTKKECEEYLEEDN